MPGREKGGGQGIVGNASPASPAAAEPLISQIVTQALGSSLSLSPLHRDGSGGGLEGGWRELEEGWRGLEEG